LERLVGEWMTVQTESGRKVDCSTSHLFMVNGLPVSSNLLKIGDEIMLIKNNDLGVDRVESIKINETPIYVYNVEVEDAHTYIGENGLFHHNAKPVE
jgi:intein/homing endonuclease